MMFESKTPKRTFAANKVKMGNLYYFFIYTDELIRPVKYRKLGQASVWLGWG
jgi:hypothetical protein